MKTSRHLALSAALLAACTACAIFPDRPTTDWPWVGMAGRAEGGGSPNYTVSGVAVGDFWVMTAGHNSGMPHNEFRFKLGNGMEFTSAQIFRHPTDDIALVRMNEALPGWNQIRYIADEQNKVFEMVGYGWTSTYSGGMWGNPSPGTYGTKRRGRNVADVLVSLTNPRGEFMVADFDGDGVNTLGGGPVTDEAHAAGGDSGCPVFMLDGAEWKIAGIMVFVGNLTGGPLYPQYGSILGAIRTSQYRTWIESIMPVEVRPTSFSLFRGVLVSGGLNELLFPDSQRLRVRPGLVLSSTEPAVQLIVDGTAPTGSMSELRFNLKAGVGTTNIQQRISLFNFQTNVYEQLDVRPATSADSTVEIVIASNPERFVHPSARTVRARVAYIATGPVLAFPWIANIDRTAWKIVR